MATNEMHDEVEEYLGTMPSFIEAMSDSTAEHGWGIMRDLELGETELPGREKALIGVGVAAALQCPYCTYFHTEEATLNGASESEIEEAANLAAATRFFSTILHGAGIDHDEFVEETDAIVDHIESQHAEAE